MGCRYPDDTIDRFWWRYANEPTNVIQTTQDVRVNIDDSPPDAVLQTNFVARNITVNLTRASNVLSTSTMAGRHKYYVALFLAEIDPRVNASGQRVFDVTVNGNTFKKDVDIYANISLYRGIEYHTKTSIPMGPISNNIIIEARAKSNSSYPASIAGVEVLQLFDNPMNATTPTSSSDGMYNFHSTHRSYTSTHNHSFVYIIQLLHVCLTKF